MYTSVHGMLAKKGKKKKKMILCVWECGMINYVGFYSLL